MFTLGASGGVRMWMRFFLLIVVKMDKESINTAPYRDRLLYGVFIDKGCVE